MVKSLTKKSLHYAAWTVALLSTTTSLALSEIWHYAACNLCWYQRILMFPLVIALGVGLLQKQKKLEAFVLPFTILGGLIAFYHSLLQWGFISERLAPCTLYTSCTTKYINWFGFLTIPFGAFLAFSAITTLMLISGKVKAYE